MSQHAVGKDRMLYNTSKALRREAVESKEAIEGGKSRERLKEDWKIQ